MVRGSGKFKTKRGGGRKFSQDMHLDHEDPTAPRSRRMNPDSDDDEDDEDEDDSAIEEEDEEEEEEEEEEEGGAGPSATAQPELTRTERRELKKKQTAQKQAQKQGIDEDDEDADLINPNHVEKKLNISDIGSRELTRKERDAKEKQDAKGRYWKLHVAGKTDEAKSDLARLKRIKQDREAAQARRVAEAEAKAAEIKKRAASNNGKRV